MSQSFSTCLDNDFLHFNFELQFKKKLLFLVLIVIIPAEKYFITVLFYFGFTEQNNI